MMPAARGSDVAYSVMLEQTGLNSATAHLAFEASLDEEPAADPDTMSVDAKRELLRQSLRRSGRDMSQLAAVGG